MVIMEGMKEFGEGHLGFTGSSSFSKIDSKILSAKRTLRSQIARRVQGGGTALFGKESKRLT